jgi:hypothetical protein
LHKLIAENEKENKGFCQIHVPFEYCRRVGSGNRGYHKKDKWHQWEAKTQNRNKWYYSP